MIVTSNGTANAKVYQFFPSIKEKMELEWSSLMLCSDFLFTAFRYRSVLVFQTSVQKYRRELKWHNDSLNKIMLTPV